MSDVEWDAEDYVPPPVVEQIRSDRWAGEDADDPIKESWEEDPDEQKDESPSVNGKPDKKKKKKLADIIADKEKRQADDKQRRQLEKDDTLKSTSPSELYAEKLRIKKIQEESDLALATDLMGVNDDIDEQIGLENIDLSSKGNLDSFRQILVSKIRHTDALEKRGYYVSFVEDLSRDLCENLELDDIKRVTTLLNTLYNEKVKAIKSTKGKKKSKAKLNLGQGAIADTYGNDVGYDDYDDFI